VKQEQLAAGKARGIFIRRVKSNDNVTEQVSFYQKKMLPNVDSSFR